MISKNNIIKTIDKTQRCQRNWDLNKQIPKEDLDIYVKNHKAIKKAVPYLDYIKTLKKIETKKDNTEPIIITF